MYFSHSQGWRLALCAAALLVLLAAAYGWRGGADGAPLAPPQGGLRAMAWEDNQLRLEGTAPAGTAVSATLDGANLTAVTNDAGVFVLTTTREQRLPARLQITVAGQTNDVLITRWQKRFMVLQRLAGEVAWQPVIGYSAPSLVGIAALTKNDKQYGATIYLPDNAKAAVVYVYADDRLVYTANTPRAFVTATLPLADSLRVDVYDTSATLQQRARLYLPPDGAASRYTMNDGTVWLFTDLAAQKAETDELIAGQFVPVFVGR